MTDKEKYYAVLSDIILKKIQDDKKDEIYQAVIDLFYDKLKIIAGIDDGRLDILKKIPNHAGLQSTIRGFIDLGIGKTMELIDWVETIDRTARHLEQAADDWENNKGDIDNAIDLFTDITGIAGKILQFGLPIVGSFLEFEIDIANKALEYGKKAIDLYFSGQLTSLLSAYFGLNDIDVDAIDEILSELDLGDYMKRLLASEGFNPTKIRVDDAIYNTSYLLEQKLFIEEEARACNLYQTTRGNLIQNVLPQIKLHILYYKLVLAYHQHKEGERETYRIGSWRYFFNESMLERQKDNSFVKYLVKHMERIKFPEIKLPSTTTPSVPYTPSPDPSAADPNLPPDTPLPRGISKVNQRPFPFEFHWSNEQDPTETKTDFFVPVRKN